MDLIQKLEGRRSRAPREKHPRFSSPATRLVVNVNVVEATANAFRPTKAW